jgi:hypothetical protein
VQNDAESNHNDMKDDILEIFALDCS